MRNEEIKHIVHTNLPAANAHSETEAEHPKGGEAFNAAFEKRIEDLKKQSLNEKRRGSLSYRRSMIWAGIETQEELDESCRNAVEGYREGRFFFDRIGRHREVDLPLTLVVANLRKEWIKEYDIKTVPEFIILDMALTSYFHFIRVNELVGNVTANVEWEIFALDPPRFRTSYHDGFTGGKKDRAIAEELAHRLQEVLQPVLDQFNRMFIRNLKALRDLRRGNILLNIGNIGQMNIGDKQINVEKQA